MIKIEHTEVFGWEASIRGLRNPLNSWDKSDSVFHNMDNVAVEDRYKIGEFEIGKNDLKLMKSLSKAGPDHSKFLRMINVTCDITAPLYWWKEFDTYKIGTVANSCSTMHKLTSAPITRECFSFDEDLDDLPLLVSSNIKFTIPVRFKELYIDVVISHCERLRRCYLETKDMRYWRALIQALPSSWNQKRTVQLNYEVLRNMYFARSNHKLSEWHSFCEWCESLPYFTDVCIQEGDANE